MDNLKKLMNVSSRENAAQFTAAAERVLAVSQSHSLIYDPTDPLGDLRGNYFELTKFLVRAQKGSRNQRLRGRIRNTTEHLVVSAINFHLNFFEPNLLGMSSRKSFEKLIKDMVGLFRRKNTDYGNAFRFWGIPGLAVRIGDKYFRLSRLSRKNCKRKVADEKLSDTALDLANYSIMLLMLLDEGRSLRWGE